MHGDGILPDTAVVLVHGIWMPGWEMALLGKRLRQHGMRPCRFAYASLRDDPADITSALAELIQSLPEGRIHLLGHSLGVRVIAQMLAEQTLPMARLGRMVALGPPLAGSQVARQLARGRFGSTLLGRSIPLLQQGLPCWPDEYPPLGVIAGDLGIGIGRLLCPLAAPHDGTVRVEETRISGVTAHTTLPVSHFSMLFSRQVAEQAVQFLQEGRFTTR